jgi:hypothetical protein
MDLLKPIDWADVATKHDVDRLAGEVDRLADEVDQLVAATRRDGERLARDIDRVAIATTRDLETLVSELRAMIAESARRVERRIWRFTFAIVLAVTIVGLGISAAVALGI